MIKYIKIIIIFFIITSCSFFSNNKNSKKTEQIRKEIILDLNNDFQLNCKEIHYKTNVNIDTVKFILKEYYQYYKYCSFNESYEIINYNLNIVHLEKIDFIQKNINLGYYEKDIFLVYQEIEMKNEIQELKLSIIDLENEIEKIEDL